VRTFVHSKTLKAAGVTVHLNRVVVSSLGTVIYGHATGPFGMLVLKSCPTFLNDPRCLFPVFVGPAGGGGAFLAILPPPSVRIPSITQMSFGIKGITVGETARASWMIPWPFLPGPSGEAHQIGLGEALGYDLSLIAEGTGTTGPKEIDIKPSTKGQPAPYAGNITVSDVQLTLPNGKVIDAPPQPLGHLRHDRGASLAVGH